MFCYLVKGLEEKDIYVCLTRAYWTEVKGCWRVLLCVLWFPGRSCPHVPLSPRSRTRAGQCSQACPQGSVLTGSRGGESLENLSLWVQNPLAFSPLSCGRKGVGSVW